MSYLMWVPVGILWLWLTVSH